MHISIATHFCGDRISATKLSVSGELASCGMEGVLKTIVNKANMIIFTVFII